MLSVMAGAIAIEEADRKKPPQSSCAYLLSNKFGLDTEIAETVFKVRNLLDIDVPGHLSLRVVCQIVYSSHHLLCPCLAGLKDVPSFVVILIV